MDRPHLRLIESYRNICDMRKRFGGSTKQKIWIALLIVILCIGLFWCFSKIGKSTQKGGCGCSLCGGSAAKEGFSTPSAWYDHIDVIYYINLDKREDRKKQFLDEMAAMGVPSNKIVRIPAVNKPGQGDWGCSMSHVNAIETMVNSGLSNCVVFEDDYEFLIKDSATLDKMFHSVFEDQAVDYDVIMFSCNPVDVKPSEYQYLNRVYDAQTASGYMVSAKFAPTLLANYQEGTRQIGESYNKGKGDHIQGPFCVDQYWKKLQPSANWYVFDPKLGKQRSSVSDIQGGFVDMTV
jgi:GR25 family glycosyltransferase involved in LPS biosynthesis